MVATQRRGQDGIQPGAKQRRGISRGAHHDERASSRLAVRGSGWAKFQFDPPPLADLLLIPELSQADTRDRLGGLSHHAIHSRGFALLRGRQSGPDHDTRATTVEF